MANTPITMLQIRRILQLKSNGKSNREIASELSISRDSANEYVRRLTELEKNFDELLRLNDQELSSLVYREPASQQTDCRLADLQQRIPAFCDELKKPHTTRRILWEEYRQIVPQGYGYAQFCEHLGRYLQVRKAVMIFDHEPVS